MDLSCALAAEEASLAAKALRMLFAKLGMMVGEKALATSTARRA